MSIYGFIWTETEKQNICKHAGRHCLLHVHSANDARLVYK